MSGNTGGGEDEEEEEEFYESLDRILSSSCSSTSASDDDDHHHRRRRHHFPRLPPPAAVSYEVWIAEPPAPVEERRQRLLQQLGLAGDPGLSRIRSESGVADALPQRLREVDIGRSLSSDRLFRGPVTPSSAILRSRSDNSVDHGNVHKPSQNQLFGSQAAGKPPLVGRSRQSSDGNIEEPDGGDGREEDRQEEDLRCTIKNLDNGSSFVVKEFREDGMWDKLKEVGTGRQLTMEEFEMCVGRSPIVQELMRRQNAVGSGKDGISGGVDITGAGPGQRSRSSGGTKSKKRGSWLRSIRNVAGTMVSGAYHLDRRSSDERDTSSEKGGRRSSSATDDSQDGLHPLHCGPERIKARQYGKHHKELTALYLSQEIQAHNGSIWSIKFSLDGRFLASAGEDCIIHVWQVVDFERKEEFLVDKGTEENGNRNPFFAAINGSPEPTLALACVEMNHWEKKRRSKLPGSRKSVSSDHLMVPEYVFALADKPICSFKGHLADVLDLSWSKSQYLLSSSMDKTVRLWHMSSSSCLKMFSHSDYVTCIQFNPVDDRYFISGSLDEKVRIWSIPDRQVVDWNDLHEMVTAACYTPDGQGALVGSHKGSCHLYDTSDNKLQQKSQIDLQNKKKRANHKKITGFQFAPGSSSEVLITSADSRIRVVDGVELVQKFKGFRNTSSQISASLTANGKYVICASEDSHVYMWRYDADSRPNRSKGVVNVTQSYEHFHCQDVTVAVPWTSVSMGGMVRTHSNKRNELNGTSRADSPVLSDANGHDHSPMAAHACSDCSQHSSINSGSAHFGDRASSTWPEEKLLMTANKYSSQNIGDSCNGGMPFQSRSAWGLVIVTAGRGGELKAFQNFGFPVRI